MTALEGTPALAPMGDDKTIVGSSTRDFRENIMKINSFSTCCIGGLGTIYIKKG